MISDAIRKRCEDYLRAPFGIHKRLAAIRLSQEISKESASILNPGERIDPRLISEALIFGDPDHPRYEEEVLAICNEGIRQTCV